MDFQRHFETLRLLPQSSKIDAEDVAFGQKTARSERFSFSVVLVALGCMYSVHNLIAPNMTAVAKLFHFNDYERDAYIGGELTLFFYFPGVFGALLAGVLSGVFDRRRLLAALSFLTSLACLSTARVGTFGELAWARAWTGFAIGGSLPVAYSLVGDWFPAKKRASATAVVTAASGVGVFTGQCIATVTGSVDWRLPFLIIALPLPVTGAILWLFTDEPLRGGQENGIETRSLYHSLGYMPIFPMRQLRALLRNRTNLLVILQAFPGNIPWGVIVVYIHDFLVQDLGVSMRSALGYIALLAAAAFAGVLVGGIVGEHLYGASTRYMAIFGGVCNVGRAIPFFIIFGWKNMFGPLTHSSQWAFCLLLMVGGFIATMGSACTGAMLLNVNLPELRGSVMAMYSILDDLSKGFGTFFISVIVRIVGGRAIAYQFSLLLWVLTGSALLYTWYTYDQDEKAMYENLDGAAKEAVVFMAKQRAQQAVHDQAKAAGAVHSAMKGERSRTQMLCPEQAHLMPVMNHSTNVQPASTCAGDLGRLPAASATPAANQRDRVRRAARAAAQAAACNR